MPTRKELLAEFLAFGITKGLSKLNKTQLTELLDRYIKGQGKQEQNQALPKYSEKEKKVILRQYTRPQLLKIISHIKIKGYSKLKHND